MTKKIQVMIVDDSALVRQVVSTALSKEPDIEVLATAADPVFAISKMKTSWPDVLVVDIEMPRMDGISFLRKIMAERPTPVIICSSPARANLKAMPRSNAAVNPLNRPKLTADVVLPAGVPTAMARTTDQLIAIGTSTGGTQALEAILTRLPATCLGIVIVQHMPEKFTAMFAERLNSICDIEVREGRNGDRVIPGRALIAPGGKHMMLKRSGAQYHVEVVDGPLVNRHRPSVDVLFRSVAKFAGSNALGIIMTGMGDDGARGMKEMHDAGAKTIAQDEASCVVFGMPKEAIRLGGAQETMALGDIPARLLRHGSKG